MNNNSDDFPYVEEESQEDEAFEDLKTGAFLLAVSFLGLLAVVVAAWWFLWIRG